MSHSDNFFLKKFAICHSFQNVYSKWKSISIGMCATVALIYFKIVSIQNITLLFLNTGRRARAKRISRVAAKYIHVPSLYSHLKALCSGRHTLTHTVMGVTIVIFVMSYAYYTNIFVWIFILRVRHMAPHTVYNIIEFSISLYTFDVCILGIYSCKPRSCRQLRGLLRIPFLPFLIFLSLGVLYLYITHTILFTLIRIACRRLDFDRKKKYWMDTVWSGVGVYFGWLVALRCRACAH